MNVAVEGLDEHQVVIDAPFVLDTKELKAITHPVSCHLLNRSEVNPGRYRYRLGVGAEACPWESDSLARVVMTGLSQRAVHGGGADCGVVWDVDSKPFPNVATEVVRDLMQLGGEHGAGELRHLESKWKDEIHEDSELYDRTTPSSGPDDRELYRRLETRIDRRSELLAWLEVYFAEGADAAITYAKQHRLV